ncbi:hypothetical protein V1477_000589 [Vespula maculifrons]|uniref:Uncharacterized protein n=3 Tax=Vespula TaxID=7451 RepID=A0A834JE94_VESGE|nr:hypothetical protein HZH68_013557 [Vespula germanica]KAF7406976.1 hypothetical protein H0235_014632 [Vespula pensylvanica]
MDLINGLLGVGIVTPEPNSCQLETNAEEEEEEENTGVPLAMHPNLRSRKSICRATTMEVTRSATDSLGSVCMMGYS